MGFWIREGGKGNRVDTEEREKEKKRKNGQIKVYFKKCMYAMITFTYFFKILFLFVYRNKLIFKC